MIDRAIQAHKAQIKLLDEFIQEMQKIIQVVQPDPKADLGPHHIIKDCKTGKAYLERLIALLGEGNLETYANLADDAPINALSEYASFDTNSGLMRQLGQKYDIEIDSYLVYEKYIEPLMEDDD